MCHLVLVHCLKYSVLNLLIINSIFCIIIGTNYFLLTILLSMSNLIVFRFKNTLTILTL
jgi:hypothetical protein